MTLKTLPLAPARTRDLPDEWLGPLLEKHDLFERVPNPPLLDPAGLAMNDFDAVVARMRAHSVGRCRLTL